MSTISISRRKFLKNGLAAAAFVAGSTGLYGTLIEPHELSIERVPVRLQRLPPALDGLTIAQLSDIHYGPFLGDEHLHRIVGATNALQPDLIALTGDFITMPTFPTQKKREHALEDAKPCARGLAGLRARLGVVAVLGNHDHGLNGDKVTRAFESSGIPVLRNRSTPVEANGARLWLSGVDDVLNHVNDLRRALQGVPNDEPAIVLVHEPDFADKVASAEHPVDLQLSGHSHGGQVRFPLIGAPYLPPMAVKYPWGLRKIGNMQLYTSRGIGTIILPVRFYNPPEITLVTLRSGSTEYKVPSTKS